jgi:hypothetical protein
MESRVAFIHIHKTGGTSLVELLNRRFGNAFIDLRSKFYDVRRDPPGISLILAHFPEVRVFSDHYLSLNLPFDVPEGKVTAITLLRDPVSRFVSHYFFHRNNRDYRLHPKLRTIDEFASDCFQEDGESEYSNYQVKRLAGFVSVEPEEMLEFTRQKINARQLLAFPLGRLDEVCIVRERLFPQLFPCHMERVNASQRDHEPSERTLELIRSRQEADYHLIRTANQQLDQLLSEVFQAPAEMEEYRSAFLRRQSAFNRMSWLKRTARTSLRKIVQAPFMLARATSQETAPVV